MSSPFGLKHVIVALFIRSVQAEDKTLLHGWQSEPNGRGTWSILWGCIATIIICTWSTLHLDVPSHHGALYLFLRRVVWMVVAATAPELILLLSAENFFKAQDELTHLTKDGHTSWTLTHMQFAEARGFRMRTSDGEVVACDSRKLRELIQNGNLTRTPISEDELTSRAKSDFFVKLLALLQILWFVIQLLVRAIQHYQITALEIMTGAFVFCSLFIYGFSWNQPQNIEYPVHLGYQDAAPAASQSGWLERLMLRVLYIEVGVVGLPLFLLLLSACGFGAIHCLAWNSPFPTSQERLAWRICSVALTGLPALGFILLTGCWRTGTILGRLGTIIVAWAYVLARITIIVLAFIGLRVLPADAFQTENWSIYLPHFAT